MQIKVVTLAGRELPIEIDPSSTVRHIKERVEEKEGIPPEQQRLVFSGKHIEDHELGLGRQYSTAGPGSSGASKERIDMLLGLVKNKTSGRNSERPNYTSGYTGHINQSMSGMAAQLARAMSPPPRTGVYAGRSVAVAQPEDLPRAVSQLSHLNRINKVREVKNLQRYHEQPGKAKWRIRMARKRREFRAGMRVLFHLALQAEKRGL